MMQHFKQSIFIICLSLMISAGTGLSAGAEELTNPPAWKSDKETSHPLVGKIWSTSDKKFINPSELRQPLQNARFILLGELHDNPDHHWLQGAIINAMGQTKQKPAVVMEMIRVDQMRRVEAYLAQEKPKAEHFGIAVHWEANGWPDWQIYLPVGQAIVKNKLEIYPGMASRMLSSHLIKQDIFALPESQQEIFKINHPLEAGLRKALTDEVRDAHCGKLPEQVIEPMSDVQRFRDAFMADVMITAVNEDQTNERKAILIAGAGHTRNDRGAPWFLKLRMKEIRGNNKPLTIQFVEANPKAETVKDLAPLTPEGDIAADYVWVTPAKSRGNYCDSIPDFGK